MSRPVRLFALLLLLFTACASPSRGRKTGVELNKIPIANDEGGALPLAKNDSASLHISSYFKAVDSKALALVQKGSPDSIREAVAALRRPNKKYSEQETVLLAICSAIMRCAWPAEKINWDVPSIDFDNLYTSTLKSIDRGIYEGVSSDTDFFTLSLPSLVLFSSSSQINYYSKAEAALKQALNLNSNSVLVCYLLGSLYLRIGNFTSAAAYFEQAQKLDPKNSVVSLGHVRALIGEGQFNAAYELSSGLLRSDQQNMEFLKLAGETAFLSGQNILAESLVAQILQIEPHNTYFLLLRARILFQLGEYLTVSTLLDVYARTNKTAKDYLLLRSRLQMLWNKNTVAALNTAQEALSRYPDDIEVLLWSGELASAAGQSLLSKTPAELVAPVLEKNPTDARALHVLVKQAVVRQDWAGAYKASSVLLVQANLNITDALIHVEICIALKRLDEARQTLQNFYTADSTDENLQQWHIRLLIAENKKIAAADIIERLLPGAGNKLKSVLYYERSRLGTNDELILGDLRSSLTANPRNQYALYDLYLYYFNRKDYRKAQYYLKQVIALNPSDTSLLTKNAELDAFLK